MSQVNITLNTNTVDINTTNNQIVVNDPSNNIVNVVQPVTTVVEVITSGPQGSPGTSSIADTGSLVTTASFNSFTSSYNTGSFTGSFTGSLLGTSSFTTSASYTATASYAPNYVPYTGATQNVDLGLNNLKTVGIEYVGSDIQNNITLGGNTPLTLSSTDAINNLSNQIEINPEYTFSRRYIQAPGFIGDYLQAPSITGSLFGTASFAISASWAPTQNNSSGSNLDSLGGVSIRTIYSRNSDITYTAGIGTNVDFMSGSTIFGSRFLPQSFFDESVNFKGKILHFRTVGKFASGGGNDTDATIYLAIGDHILSGSNLGKQDIDFSSNKPFEILGELIITAGSSSACYSIAWCDQTGDLRRTPLGDVTVSGSFANTTPGEFKIIISGSTTRNMTTYYSYLQVYN